MTKRFFVTGTDTEVGKTVASRALLQAANREGFKSAGYKPVASGSDYTAGDYVMRMRWLYSAIAAWRCATSRSIRSPLLNRRHRILSAPMKGDRLTPPRFLLACASWKRCPTGYWWKGRGLVYAAVRNADLCRLGTGRAAAGDFSGRR